MLSLGMDIGTSTVKLVLLKNQEIEKQWMAVHHGNPFVCLKKGLSTLELAMDTPFSLCVTGSNTEALQEQDSAIPSLGDIPAIVEGVRWIIPQVGSVIEIGSQGARFITDLQSRAPQFSVNEHCAGGTGSFFEDQMSRVGCKLEDYSSLVEQAQSVPRLSGRCAVFAKTDIIHRQQEGVSTPDILLGLCYAMIRNYKVTIVRRLPVCKPVVFCGGVTCNTGVIRAIREVFGLTEEELIVLFFNTKVRILAQKRLRDRLKIYLQTLTPDEKGCYSLPYTRTELADFLCVDRSALSRELCRMRDERILDFFGAKIHLLNPTFLYGWN